jgi:hypothetical protein
MAIKIRADLRSNFFPGAKPPAAAFNDVIDSALNLEDNKNQALKSSITISTYEPVVLGDPPPDGTIAKVASELQVFFGGIGKPVGGGGLPLANLPVNAGTDTASGITIESNTPGQGINLGAINTAISPVAFRGAAILGNKTQFTIDNAAVMQEQAGNTWLNAPAAGTVRISTARTPGITITRNNMEFTIQDPGGATQPEFLFKIGTKRALAIKQLNPSSIRATVPPNTLPGTDGILQIYGDIHQVNAAGAWVTSDARLKKDIQPFAEGLEKIKNINPVQFKYNGLGDTRDGRPGIGVIAQEIKALMPYSVRELPVKLNDNDKEETDVLLFDDHALTYVLINAVKELSARIEELEKK